MKKILVILYILVFTSLYAFAEHDITKRADLWSIKKWSTAGIYETYSDQMRASRIFELTNGIVSLQYSPLDLRKGDNTMGLEVYLGAQASENMYLAFAGSYDPRVNNMLEYPNLNNAISNTTPLVIRPMIRFNKILALEYTFSLHRSLSNTTLYYKSGITHKHRVDIAASIGDKGYLDVPFTVSFQKEKTDTSGTITDANIIRLIVEPEFLYKINKNSLRTLNFKLLVGADLVNQNGVMNVKNPYSYDVMFSITPALRWRLKNDIVFLGIDPEIGVKANIASTGASALVKETDSFDVGPFFYLPIGTIFKIGNYVEFRAGFRYDFQYSYHVKTDKNASPSEKSSEHKFFNDAYVFTGFGINAGEDASLDFMVALLIPTNNGKNFGLKNFGIQASYRF